MGGPSPSYYHVACMEWSISEDNRKTCKGCPAKLTKGGDRIGCLQYDPWGHRNIEGYWHPACFQQGLKHFGSTLEIEGLRGAPPALKAKHPRGEAAATEPHSKKIKSQEEASAAPRKSSAPKKARRAIVQVDRRASASRSSYRQAVPRPKESPTSIMEKPHLWICWLSRVPP